MRLQMLFAACSALAPFVYALNNTTTTWPWQTFRSLPGLEPPVLSINKTGPASPGHIFFPISGDGAHNYSLVIYQEDGELIWQSGYGDYAAFRPTTLFGKPVLAYFSGVTFPEPWGFGYGVVNILNQQYENIYNVTLWNDTLPLQSISPLYDPTQYQPFSWIDMHENLITPEGTMFVGALNVTPWDLSSIGGAKDGWVVDSLILEINVTNSAILWQWSHLDHVDEIPLKDAVATYPLEDLGRNSSYPWGPFHINSVERFDDGSLLVSSRHYCSLFKIARNGSVEWTLNGHSGGDFTLANNLSFCYQHDARLHASYPNIIPSANETLISLFNNDNSAVVSGVDQTTGLLISLNIHTKIATQLRAFADRSEPLYSKSQGSMQVRDGGEVVMGYGSVPALKEYSPDGEVVLSARWGQTQEVQSYRAYKAVWEGRPSGRPDVAACWRGNETEVYMSWNGATGVDGWGVFGGSHNGTLQELAMVEKRGFETRVVVEGKVEFVKAQASSEGFETGLSRIIAVERLC